MCGVLKVLLADLLGREFKVCIDQKVQVSRGKQRLWREQRFKQKTVKKTVNTKLQNMSEFLPDALGIQLNAPQPQPDKYNIFIYHRWTVELFLSVSFCCVIDFKKGAYPKKFGHVLYGHIELAFFITA